MYQILFDLLADKTTEERLTLLATLYYECGSRRILDIVRASFS